MAESCWMFVESVPLLCDEKRVARQLKVETWLDLAQLLKEVKDSEADKNNPQQAINYVV